jgi:three-Cys-motif partner protein
VSSSKFFDERTDQSEVKARIIQKYFFAWARVIIPTAKTINNRIAYIDLYAGPGRYKDGSASTPLLVLEGAIQDPDLSKMLVALLNDQDANHTRTLQQEIDGLPGIETLAHKPVVMCGSIDQDAEAYFKKTRLIPSFTFVDPFGYKGLSLGIINGVIKNWGCDCVFFFNYARINAGLSNPKVEDHMDALFTADRAATLRTELQAKTPAQREALILENLAQAIKGMGGKFVLPFRFKNSSGTRTSHSLVFVSKHFKGYEIMKEIMAKESSTQEQGVPSLAYSPREKWMKDTMPLLFALSRPLDDLGGMLLNTFAGERLSMVDIYKRHNVDTPYIKKNYKEALMALEQTHEISANPPIGMRKKGTFADHVMVTFPKRKKK